MEVPADIEWRVSDAPVAYPDALAFMAATVATVAALCAYVYSIVWRYARKRASDQSLLLAQWWFVLTVSQVLSAATVGPWQGAAWLIPFVAYVTVARVLLGRVRRLTATRIRPWCGCPRLD